MLEQANLFLSQIYPTPSNIKDFTCKTTWIAYHADSDRLKLELFWNKLTINKQKCTNAVFTDAVAHLIRVLESQPEQT